MASSLFHCLLIFLSISGAATADRRRHPRPHHYPPPSPAASVAPSNASSIHRACRATRFPDQCDSALSQLATSLPPSASAADITLSAMSLAARNLNTAQSNAQAILDASAYDLNRTNAARNCLDFLSSSDRRLSAAMRSLQAGALADARAFAGAAELYQYDCWSALKYVDGTQQVADAMTFLVGLSNLTGTATAMLAALQRYGSDTSLWGPPQTERDGYWPKLAVRAPATVEGFPPAGKQPDATVCKEGAAGGCGFATVQGAVDAAPEHSTGRFVIYIKAGEYEEIVRVGFEKPNLVFIGDGMGKTIITGSLNADTVGLTTYNTATVGLSGDGFMACNLTFANTAGPDAHQAVAFRSDSDLSVLLSVEFLGHQDTLYAHSLRQFYKSCRISGTVDFIFGNSAAVFLDSLIFVLPRQLNPEKGESNTVTAHGRTDPAQPTGFVFQRCAINGSDEYLALYRSKPAVHRTYLGRPWKEYSRTVLIDCELGEIVRPEGWMPWSGDFALQTLYYGEYGSSGAGAIPASRVAWSSQVPAEHLAVYSPENFIQGGPWIPSDLEAYDL